MGWYTTRLNRSAAGLPLLRKEADNEAFERIMIEAHGRQPTRILAWCVMRHHWHFVVWPREEGELTAHFRWLAHTHAMRWHVAHNTVGRGHLYQGVSRVSRPRRTGTFSRCVVTSNAMRWRRAS